MRKTITLVLSLLMCSFIIHADTGEIDFLSYANPDNGIIQGRAYDAGRQDDEDPRINTFGAYSDVDKVDAFEIINEFISENPNNFKNWQKAQIDKVIPLWSIEGLLHGYNAKIVSKDGRDAGSVIIDAWHTYAPYIFSFKHEGLSEYEVVIRLYEKETKKNLDRENVKYRFLYNGMSEVALQVFEKNKTQLYSYRPDVNIEDYRAVNRLNNYKAYIQHLSEQVDDSEDLRVREYASINYAFTPFWQENRTWKYSTSGGNKCKSGCAPVAVAIIADYWDNNGFPKLIGTAKEQSHHTSDTNVRFMIDEFRKDMKTYCDGVAGATYTMYVPNITKYFHSRGGGGIGVQKI